MPTTDLLAGALIDPVAALAERDALVAFLASALDNVEVRRGAVHDLVVHVLAVGASALRDGIETEVKKRSLLEVLETPELSTPEVIAAALGNYRVTLRGAVQAVGEALLIVDSPTPVSLPAGMLFRAGAVLTRVARLVIARADATLISGPEEQALVSIGGGLYTFRVPLEAVEAGLAGRLQDGQALEPVTPIAHLVSARVQGDFTGGASAESPEAALSRLRAGTASRAWSNRSTIEALVRSDARFADLRSLSIVGSGDLEQVRARRNFLGVAQPGRCDVYVRLNDGPLTTIVPLVAHRIGPTSDGDLWQVDLPHDAAPGFHEVLGVADPAAGPSSNPLVLTSVTRGLDISDGGPDLATAEEAAFGPFSTAIIRFVDPAPVAGQSVDRPVHVRVTSVPGVAELHAMLTGRDVRPPGGDVHVRAYVPAFASIAIRAQGPSSAQALADQARSAAAAAIASQGASGSISTSPAAAAAQSVFGAAARVTRVDLLVRVLRPDGTTWIRHATDALDLPDEPDRSCTRRTITVYCGPADATVSLGPPPEL